jgi:hypothetical protein
MDYPDLDEINSAGRSARVGALLDYLGWIVIISALVWGVFSVVRIAQVDTAAAQPAVVTDDAVAGSNPASSSADKGQDANEIVTVFALMLLWSGGGVLLWGVSEVIRRIEALQSVNEVVAAQTSSTAAGERTLAQVETESQQSMHEMALLLREVRDISLLTSEQRAMRLQAQGNAVLELLKREVPLLLREHNWIEARNRVLNARERFPTFRDWDHMEQQIEHMRAQVEQHDIEGGERQISDLTALGAWDRVEEVVKELLERHPDSIRAIDLAHKLRERRNHAEAEQRAKLMAQAQGAANDRDWELAVNAASALIQRFPQSPESQALRMQLPVLRENSQIKDRQRMENEIRELIKASRFEDALRLARELIDQYPASPQAEVLRDQLPRLEQKAMLVRR